MITFDPDALTVRRAELEQRMGEPGFWDDQDRAAKISTEHSRVTRKLESYGLDLVEPAEPVGGEPTYRLRG